MKITNNWIGYFQRTKEQTFSSVIAKMRTYLPEITDWSDGNPLVRMVDFMTGILEHLGYYADSKGREAFLATARKFESGVYHAESVDYRVKGWGAASVDLTFSFDPALASGFTVPSGTEVETKQGVKFFTTEDLNLSAGGTSGVVSAKQWITVAGVVLGQTTAAADQKFVITGSPQVVDGSVQVEINNETWISVESFFESSATDKHFVAAINKDGNMEVRFGDDKNGAIPASGYDVEVSYKTTSGLDGNKVNAGTITEIVSTLSPGGGEDVTCTNASKASGGFDRETLTDLQKRVPLFVRTLDVALTGPDYADKARLYPGVADASFTYKCGQIVNLWISPSGGGFASSQLLSDVEAIFNDTKKQALGKVADAKSAGVVTLKLSMVVYAKTGYYKSEISASVKDALLDYLSAENQRINGEVPQSDIYEIAETKTGVEKSNITLMKVVPYARPIESTTTVLNWTREINDNSTLVKRWLIKFYGATQFQLFQEDLFVGNFTTGNDVSLSDIEFNITADGYVAGDVYEFYTYPASGDVALAEQSYIYSESADITIQVQGGL